METTINHIVGEEKPPKGYLEDIDIENTTFPKLLLRAKKKFGQNFLKDQSVLAKIIEAMPKNNHKVVEIGPGLGDLTKFLVDVKSVEAFEVDTDLCKLLQSKFDKEITTNLLHINCGDVLEAWQGSLINEDYDLVANLPYYIATKIILKKME